MSKLRLEIEELKVDSFETDAPAEEHGIANFITRGYPTCYDCTRFGCPGTELC